MVEQGVLRDRQHDTGGGEHQHERGHDDDGERRGYFGPVLNAMPNEEEGLAIWDGLSTLAPVTSFYELKRTRPGGGPDTASTEGL